MNFIYNVVEIKQYVALLHFNNMAKKKTSPSFEEDLAELEQLVVRLERGEVSLEESLQAFERGVTLTRACQKALQEAEQKVQILIDKNGSQVLESFADE
ncbi:exodeoxyribonuclease 7 small subunit [Methyloglobulus morosus KoM1]|uniref:Exodeoxyribonuclease 7 small subunit n=2 Tax=Methyloglobulus TaxID=1410680 RepID=V5BLD4_9GAMM|nr:exodeoxyribonuclease 7 small subunit [Methyloglobulus morosus KoM1]